MNNDNSIYSYAGSWENQLQGEVLWGTIKRTYRMKCAWLMLATLFDIFLLPIILIRRMFGPAKIVSLTNKWPRLISALPGSQMLFIGPPTDFIRSIRCGGQYFPASPVYLFVTFGMHLNKVNQKRFSYFAQKICSFILEKMCAKTSYTIVVHSDALPFARSFVMAANDMSAKTICIQHGNFHVENIISEIDGSLSSVNIARSNVDVEIIRSSSPGSKIILAPGFFRPQIANIHKGGMRPFVLLIGEGFHIVDEKFNRAYISRLQEIAAMLMSRNLDVIFRPHPSERNLNWKSKFEFIDTTSLEERLSQVDAVIGYSSTLLFEASSLDIIAVSIDVNGRFKVGIDLIRNHCAIHKWGGLERFLGLIADKRAGVSISSDILRSQDFPRCIEGEKDDFIIVVNEILSASN